MDNNYIIQTDYFTRPWTWIKRFLEFVIAGLFLYWISLQETETNYFWIKYLLFGLLTIFIFVRPKDELALDSNCLYYIKKSLLPFLTQTKKYKITDIRSIGCAGIFDRKTEFFGLAASGTNRNRLEIVFKDNSSKIHGLTIYKDELITIVRQVSGLVKQNCI